MNSTMQYSMSFCLFIICRKAETDCPLTHFALLHLYQPKLTTEDRKL